MHCKHRVPQIKKSIFYFHFVRCHRRHRLAVTPGRSLESVGQMLSASGAGRHLGDNPGANPAILLSKMGKIKEKLNQKATKLASYFFAAHFIILRYKFTI